MNRKPPEKALSDLDPYAVANAMETYVRAMDASVLARTLKKASRRLPPYYRGAIAAQLARREPRDRDQLDPGEFERLLSDVEKNRDLPEALIVCLRGNLRAIPFIGSAFARNVARVANGENPVPGRDDTVRLTAAILGALVAAIALGAFGSRTIVESRVPVQRIARAVVTPAPHAMPVRRPRTIVVHHRRPSKPVAVRKVATREPNPAPVRHAHARVIRRIVRHVARARKPRAVARVRPRRVARPKVAVRTVIPVVPSAVPSTAPVRRKRGVFPFLGRLLSEINPFKHHRHRRGPRTQTTVRPIQ